MDKILNKIILIKIIVFSLQCSNLSKNLKLKESKYYNKGYKKQKKNYNLKQPLSRKSKKRNKQKNSRIDKNLNSKLVFSSKNFDKKNKKYGHSCDKETCRICKEKKYKHFCNDKSCKICKRRDYEFILLKKNKKNKKIEDKIKWEIKKFDIIKLDKLLNLEPIKELKYDIKFKFEKIDYKEKKEIILINYDYKISTYDLNVINRNNNLTNQFSLIKKYKNDII